jgi:pimeloyl-ACP methyl ester carboxylesterase
MMGDGSLGGGYRHAPAPAWEWRRVALDGFVLDVLQGGAGRAVVFPQTALTADESLPLAQSAALRDGYSKVVYHRRGYGASSAPLSPGSVARDARDCLALMDALSVTRADIVGVSYSCAIALQLASVAPDRVRSLTLIEPPPVHAANSEQFREASEHLLSVRRERGVPAALEEFLAVALPSFVGEAVAALPGAVEQMRRDATTFFDFDIPALLSWDFGAEDAARVTCPVLYVGGSERGPLFREVPALVGRWFPGADQAIIPGAGHSVALTHTDMVAKVLSAFLARHRA